MKVPITGYINDPLYVTQSYESTAWKYNSSFSILTLAEPVSDVMPACLPVEVPQNYVGKVATVTGWGRLGNYQTTDNLREVDVTVIPNEQCREEYGSYYSEHVGDEK